MTALVAEERQSEEAAAQQDRKKNSQDCCDDCVCAQRIRDPEKSQGAYDHEHGGNTDPRHHPLELFGCLLFRCRHDFKGRSSTVIVPAEFHRPTVLESSALSKLLPHCSRASLASEPGLLCEWCDEH